MFDPKRVTFAILGMFLAAAVAQEPLPEEYEPVRATPLVIPRPEGAAVMPKVLPQKRGPATFNGGVKAVSQSCAVRKEPLPAAEILRRVEPGEELRLEAFDSRWHQVVTDEGRGFIETDCF